MEGKEVCIFIPARYGSSRFEGKPLAEIHGKPMIWHVYQQCIKSKLADKVVVLTDDHRIVDTVTQFGGHVLMTNIDHPSGTDRIGEALHTFTSCSIAINVQGDEPLIDTSLIDALIVELQNGDATIVTACNKLEDSTSLFDYNVVKVVRSVEQNALYFSRQAIPAFRDLPYKKWMESTTYFRHLGIYGYKANTLLELINLPPSFLEKSESLEQLRWLENGFQIKCILSDYKAIGVDVPEDIAKVEAVMGI